MPVGTDVSYGRTHTLARDSRLAVVTARYGDAEITVAEVCADTEPIAWEALCTITKRVKLLYLTNRITD